MQTDVKGIGYLVPGLGTLRLVLGTAAGATCPTGEHESQANWNSNWRLLLAASIIKETVEPIGCMRGEVLYEDQARLN